MIGLTILLLAEAWLLPWAPRGGISWTWKTGNLIFVSHRLI